jgi:polyhydroxybutyrate depolymerase
MKQLLFIFLSISFTGNCQILRDSILVDNNYRTFQYLKSSQAKSSLVFVLHGSGGSGDQMRKSTSKLESIAEAENITLVYPDGYKKYWNECRKNAKSEANILDINDNAFFAKMIDYFEKNQSINTKKVFVVGTSGGGHMAYKLAITMPERFRAITAIIANLPDTNNMDCAERHIPLPVMIVNGTADPLNHYNGGEMIMAQNVSYGYVRSTQRSLQYWAQLAGYKRKPKMYLLPDIDPTDGKTIEKYVFKKGIKPEVTLLKVIGGKHDYPNDIDVHLEAWAFFKRQF